MTLASPVSEKLFAHQPFPCAHLHGRQKFPVRELLQSFFSAADSDKLLYIVIPGLNLLITNRPRNRDSFPFVCLEVQIAPAVNLASPHDGTATYLAPAKIEERFIRWGGVRVFLVVYKKIVVVLAAGVTLLLNRIVLIHEFSIAEPTKLNVIGSQVL